ncbi:hypothetical protein GGI07_000595 [Coemansia sp. Benny D115]|nr:hypothetical protein GGI07_000595 [Coemansia sp. Benny D115]
MLGVAKLLPSGTATRVYVFSVMLLAAVFILAESYILYLTRQSHETANRNQWQIQGVQEAVSTSITTYMVYNVLFILAQVYIIFLCVEALVQKNTIQVIAVVVFYFICLTYTTVRYIAFYVLPSLAARMFTRNSNMQLMQIGVMTMYVIALVSLVILSYKLKMDVGWNVFKRLGADIYPYADSRPFLMITIVTCLLLVISTGIVSVMCIRNFDSGLKEAIAYEEMRIKHRKMYAEAVDTDESEKLMTDVHHSTAQERFTLE